MKGGAELTPLGRLAAAIEPGSRQGLAKRHIEGSHRSEHTTRTLKRLLAVAPRAGITRLSNVTGLDRIGIPVVMAVRPSSRTLSVWQGKSHTLEGAKISGLMEAIETACAETPPRATDWASALELGALVPRSLFRRTTGWLSIMRERMGWLRGYDVTRRCLVRVPRRLVGLGPALGAEDFFSELGTNGLAGGNDVIEAALHGICELIERDAEALWHASSRTAKRRSHMNLATVDDPVCRDTLNRFHAARIAVTAFDVTSDLGVPAFLALIDDSDGPAPRLGRFGGTGCHPTPEVALFRALSEAAQSRLTFIVGAREDIAAANYALTGMSRLLAPLLDSYASERPRPFSPGAGFRSMDIAEDLRWVVGRLSARKIRHVIAVDLGRADLGIPVVRMIAPDLENLRHQAGYRPSPRARAIARRSAG